MKNGFVEKEKIEKTINWLIDKGKKKATLTPRKIKTRWEKRKRERKRNPNSRKRVVLIGDKNMRP